MARSRSRSCRSMTAITADAERTAKLDAPNLRGFYAATIAGSATAVGGYVQGVVQAGGGPLPVNYAGYINQGTRRMRARPGIRKAVERSVADSQRHIRAAIIRITEQLH